MKEGGGKRSIRTNRWKGRIQGGFPPSGIGGLSGGEKRDVKSRAVFAVEGTEKGKV